MSARKSRAKDPVLAYAKAVLSEKIVAGPYVRKACARHIGDLKRKRLHWRLDRALKAIDFFAEMLVLESGQPFVLHPWQAFVVGSCFGWYGPDGFRRFRTAYVETGKGSGKTPLAAGIGLYGLVADGEPAPEVYSAATDRDQAKICFKDAVRMVEASPELTGLVRVQAPLTGGGSLTIADDSATFRPVSSEHKGLDGLRVHIGLIDELQEHPSATVVDKIRAGTKQRRNALIFEITNSGWDRTSVCWMHHELSVKVIEGSEKNDSWFAYVCALDGPSYETYHFYDAVRHMVDSCSCGKLSAIGIASISAEVFARAVTDGSSANGTRSTESANESLPSNGSGRIQNAGRHIGKLGSLLVPDIASQKRRPSVSDVLDSMRKALSAWPSDRAENARSARRAEGSSSITTTQQGNSVDSSAPSATAAWVCSEILLRVFAAHSDTCGARSGATVSGQSLAVTLPGDEWTDEACWLKVNPSLGTVLPIEYLREQVRDAHGMPSKENIVKRLNFCVWTEQADRWLEMSTWDACPATSLVLANFNGRSCMAGLDGASSDDIFAFVMLFGPDEDGYYDAIPRFWIPKDTLAARASRRTEADRLRLKEWAERGFIRATDGATTNYDVIESEILSDLERLQLKRLSYDRFGVTQLVTHLQDALGEEKVVQFAQTISMMSAPSKELEKVLRDGKLRHGGNPVLRWMASNVALMHGRDGQVKPDGLRSGDKIDGVEALIMALDGAMRQPKQSVDDMSVIVCG